MKGSFAKWFTLQHGPRTRFPKTSDKELAHRAAEGVLAQAELDMRKLWDEKRTSALYAWQVQQEPQSAPHTARQDEK
jgi:hypothetical protein